MEKVTKKLWSFVVYNTYYTEENWLSVSLSNVVKGNVRQASSSDVFFHMNKGGSEGADVTEPIENVAMGACDAEVQQEGLLGFEWLSVLRKEVSDPIEKVVEKMVSMRTWDDSICYSN